MSDRFFPLKTRPHSEVRKRSRGRLPHWEIENAIYFVTFNLQDSIPKEVMWRLIHACILKITGRSCTIDEVPDRDICRVRKLIYKNTERILDKGYGTCPMSDHANAEIMENALRFFDGERYQLHGYCVMPNHVHVVFQTLNGSEVGKIIKSWKGFSAVRINRMLERSGRLWKREYFDRIIRDQDQYDRILKYVNGNPLRAGLDQWKYSWNSPELYTAVMLDQSD